MEKRMAVLRPRLLSVLVSSFKGSETSNLRISGLCSLLCIESCVFVGVLRNFVTTLQADVFTYIFVLDWLIQHEQY